MKTTLANTSNYTRQWYVIDASKEVLGRMAAKIAHILRGRNKAIYTPHVDAGDFVVVINAEKVLLTGKKNENKTYMSYSGYVGNPKYRTVEQYRAKNPRFIIEHAVKGMLPKNKLADKIIGKLKVYAGSEHPHSAQNPQSIN